MQIKIQLKLQRQNKLKSESDLILERREANVTYYYTNVLIT